MSEALRTVYKFGGAALADGPGVRRVVSIVADWPGWAGGGQPVLVVSAHSGVTALLRRLADEAVRGSGAVTEVRVRHRSLCAQLGLESELLDRYWVELAELLSGIASRGQLSSQDRDAVLSIGERVSARIVAKSLRAEGILATPVDAFDLGFVAEGQGSDVRPSAGSSESVRSALAEVPGVPVVTGFLARTATGLVTTLGPNGSDWTAAWLAEVIGAGELVFWKAVAGVMTADPKLVSAARVIEELPYSDAFELARHGAEVLHPKAVEPARRARVHVAIRDVTNPPAKGTVLVEAPSRSVPVAITALREDSGVVRIAIVGGEASTAQLADQLGRAGIDCQLHPSELACLNVCRRDLEPAVRILHASLFERDASLQLVDRDS